MDEAEAQLEVFLSRRLAATVRCEDGRAARRVTAIAAERSAAAPSAGHDFAVRAAVARAHGTARACRLACAIGHGRRARHPDSGSHATSRSRAHQ